MEQALELLSKRRLERLRSEVLVALSRYEKPRVPKYGLLSRAFSQEELERFFTYSTCKRATVMFLLMSGLGLRVSEVCTLRARDVRLADRRVYVRTAKNRLPASLYLHDRVYYALAAWIRGHEALITTSGYVFPGCRDGHSSQAWLGNQCRETLRKAGLVHQYDTAVGRKTRPLYRLSMHSFRHYYGTTVQRQQKNLFITQKLMRHQNISSTMIYLHATQEELDQALVSVFAEKL